MSLPSPIAPVARQPIRRELHDRLEDAIVRGELRPGRAVNIARLAARFGVSVTPVREASIELAQSGLLEAPLARGFVVPLLTVREVQEIYPLIWTLETFALRAAPPPARELRELRRLTDELSQERNPARAIALDRSWHRLLLAAYDNDTFREVLARLKTRAARYEYAYMRDHARVLESAEQHKEILEALERGEIETAARLLEENWRIGPRYLLPWLERRPGTPERAGAV